VALSNNQSLDHIDMKINTTFDFSIFYVCGGGDT
jgi:hypothetical protein